MKKLSYSRIKSYQECPKKFEYHYIKKIRDPIAQSSLLFGSALDKTINDMLLDKKNNNLKKLGEYVKAFRENWRFGYVNDILTELKHCTDIAYAESDIDYEIIKTDIKRHKELVEKKKEVTQLKMGKKDVAEMNAVFWECLAVKGRCMVETFYKVFLPDIKEVLEVQKRVSLKNADGDEVEGYVDCVLDLGDGPVICDLKTSSIKYTGYSANISPQLATYVNALRSEYNTNKVAFIVLYKQMMKDKIKMCETCLVQCMSQARKCDNIIEGIRCNGAFTTDINPKAKLEVITGFIKDSFEEHVMENYHTILHAIREEIFPRNWNSCMAYNRPCPYMEACHKGKKI